MPKKHFWLNLTFLIGASFVILGFEHFCFDVSLQNKENIAFAQTCKPVDVILVIDKSGSMSDKISGETETKMEAAKGASNDFINLLGVNDHIGIVSFSDDASLDQTLTDDKNAAKNAVNSLTPGGGTYLEKGIGAARLEFNSIRSRFDSPHAMIILTDGKPSAVALAISQANITKNQGVRIIVIGYDIGSTSDPEGTRTILKTIASSPTPPDYQEAPTTEELKNIYTSLVAQMCDSNPPEIASITRLPSGTVFLGDEINITSTATDNTDGYDWGLFNHRIEWTVDNWGTTNSCESPTLNLGDKVNTFTCDIGPFPEGTEIKYRSFAKDLALYETYSAEASFEVAAVTILNTYLIVDQSNTIKVEIDDPQGKSHFNKYYVEIESPPDGAIKLFKTEMSCSYLGSIYECSFDVTPNGTWAPKAKIIIYPWDNDLGFHNPAAQKEVDVISDTNPPTLVIIACNISKNDVVGDSCDLYGGDVISDGGFVLDTDTITLVSIAGDVSGIQNQKIFYWVNGTPFIEEWIITGEVSTIKTTTVGPYSGGTLIEYKTEATDVWNNTAYDPSGALKYSFNVYNAECYNAGGTPKADLTPCAGGTGKCCGGICDTSFSCSLDDECRGEICSGASWTCGAQNEGANCCDGANCDGCFAYNNGCEKRDYSCLAGNCAYSFSNRNDDICSGQNYLNYQCIGISCNLIETIDCSLAGNWDGDLVACNCDCDDYDVEETILNGNCEDGKDNDCDGLTDCEEPACDDEAPVTVITADDSSGIPIAIGGDVLDTDTNRVSLTLVSFELTALPCVTSPNVLYQIKVFYNENDSPWNLIFTCTDADGDGQCEEDATKNIANFDVEIPVNGFSAGTKVGYKSEAFDTAPTPNAGVDEGFFNVISVECQGMPDLTPCTGGKCCTQVCDTGFDCSLDSACQAESCSGTSWECKAGNEGASCGTDWTKFRAIEINNSNNPSDLTDYQVKLNIAYDLDMRLDFGDLRFVDKDGDNLSYWIEEKTDSVSAVVWVKVSSVPANKTEYIYMHYGNAAVESVSDAENTFIRVIDGGQPLKGNWSFDKTSGINTPDTSGNGNNGTLINMDFATDWVDGKFGKAFDFDGADDYVEISDNNSLDITEEITIEMWINSPNVSNGTTQRLFHKNGAYTLGLTATNGRLGFYNFGSAGWAFSNLNVLSDNTWLHIVVTKNSTDGVKFYVNGADAGSEDDATDKANLGISAVDVYIGMDEDGHSYPFNGTIDEVRIYNRALSEEEISDLYDNYGYTTPNAPGKVLVRKYADPEPTTFVRTESTCPSLDFDGTDDYVDCGNNPSLNITGPLTLEAWAKPIGEADNYDTIIAKADSYSLVMKADKMFHFYIKDSGGFKHTYSITIADGVSWYHVVATYDGTNLRIYVNGVLERTPIACGSPIISEHSVGMGNMIGGYTYWFDGTIDEVRVYNRELSVEEVQEHYNGIFTDETGLAGLWHFDDTTGGIVTDSSGNGNNGVLKPNYPTNAPTLIDKCPPFNPEENIDYTPGCFPFDTGCEQKGSPVCGSGYCNISRNRCSDYCQDINYMDYDCGAFTKRVPVAIDNSGNPSALTDYQVKLSIAHDPNMQPDFDDLRFVDKNGAPLNYWFEEKIDGVSAIVWVKVPSILANGTENIYMHYGNPSVEPASSGADEIFGYSGAGNYAYLKYSSPSFYWEDKVSSTDIANGDEAGSWQNLQFDFPFWGEEKDKVFVICDGLQVFKPSNESYTDPAFHHFWYQPLINTLKAKWIVAPFWSDLKTNVLPGDGVYFDNFADKARFTWEATSFSGVSSIKFQSIFFPSGKIIISLDGINNLGGFSPSPLLGISKGDSLNYIEFSSEKGIDKSWIFYLRKHSLPEPTPSFGAEEDLAASICSVVFSDPDPSCDVVAPTVSIEAKDNTDAVILDGGKIHPSLTDKVTLTSIAFDNYILQSHQVQYRVNSGGWITLFDCDDTDLNGFCDDDDQDGIPFEAGENSTISITFLSGSALNELKIGSFVHNDVVEYRGIAVDIAQPDPNTTITKQSFVVKIPNIPPTVTPTAAIVYPNGSDYWRSSGANCWKSLQINVIWSYFDADGDLPDAYQVEVYNDAGYTSLIFDSCDPPGSTCASGNSSEDKIIPTSVLDWNTEYWWRVKVYDGEDWSDFENGSSFKTPLHPYPTIDFTFAPDPSLLDAPVDVDFTQASGCYTTANPGVAVPCGTGNTKIIHIGWDFYRETNTKPNPPNGLGELLDVNIDNAGGINPSDTYGFTFYRNMPYPVYLQITDQDGYTCSVIKEITPGGMKHPWWKEILPK